MSAFFSLDNRGRGEVEYTHVRGHTDRADGDKGPPTCHVSREVTWGLREIAIRYFQL